MDADRGRACPVRLAVHQAAAVGRPERGRQRQTDDRRPCDLALSPCQRLHSA